MQKEKEGRCAVEHTSSAMSLARDAELGGMRSSMDDLSMSGEYGTAGAGLGLTVADDECCVPCPSLRTSISQQTQYSSPALQNGEVYVGCFILEVCERQSQVPTASMAVGKVLEAAKAEIL